MKRSHGRSAVLVLSALTVATALAAHAGSHVYPGNDPKWESECGSCHLAFPAQLLPVESWRRMLAGLDRHFGVDASMAPGELRQIAKYLETNSAAGKMAEIPPPARITEAAWFRREHRKIPVTDWKSPREERPANCAACHPGAGQGDFSERHIRFWR